MTRLIGHVGGAAGAKNEAFSSVFAFLKEHSEAYVTEKR